MDAVITFIEEFFKYIATNWDKAWTFQGTGHVLLALSETGLVGFLLSGLKNLWKRAQERKLAKDLHPFFSLQEVQRARTHYIPTRFQNVNPARQDEPGQTAASIARQKIMPFFMKEAFDPGQDDQRFYLVLAGSGMGKTTFMLNLYRLYVKRWRKRPYNMVLLPFGNSQTQAKLEALVKSGEDKNIILLLDAFDEDQAAMQGKYRERLDSLMDLVQGFREVVITSRTQFFESEDDIPGELKIKKAGNPPGYHTFKRLYVAPFNKTDIQQYLNKKYGLLKFWNRKKKQRAEEIALGKSIDLMARPMLLSNIDDLLERKDDYTYTYQIYEALIEAWLQREASRVEEGRREKFKADLYNFSQKAANYMFGKAQVNADLTISPLFANTFAKDYDIDLSSLDLRSRSLLNVKANGEYKFSHKSIFEYFLALEMKENKRSYYKLHCLSSETPLNVTQLYY